MLSKNEKEKFELSLDDIERKYTLRDLWYAFIQGEYNMDNDGCQIDNEDIAFKEVVNDIEIKKPAN